MSDTSRRAKKAKATPPKANPMWGGRFGVAPDAIMQKINASIDVDKRLYAEDIAGSKAHARMLAKAKILTAKDAAKIVEGLDKVGAEPAGGTPEQFAKTYRDESEGWKALIQRAGIKPE